MSHMKLERVRCSFDRVPAEHGLSDSPERKAVATRAQITPERASREAPDATRPRRELPDQSGDGLVAELIRAVDSGGSAPCSTWASSDSRGRNRSGRTAALVITITVRGGQRTRATRRYRVGLRARRSRMGGKRTEAWASSSVSRRAERSRSEARLSSRSAGPLDR